MVLLGDGGTPSRLAERKELKARLHTWSNSASEINI